MDRPPPVYTSVQRSWRKVDVDALRDAIRVSRLCRSDLASETATIDELAELYSAELLAIADRLAPARSVTVRRRVADPWFDDECRAEKRSVRAAERCSQLAADVAAWRSLRRR
jgi:hypothetical protein